MNAKLNNIKGFLLTNSSTKQTIFKNTFWQTVGTLFNKLLSLFLIIWAARILGAEEYGKFNFAIAFVSLLIVFSDLGLSAIIVREFARKEEKKEEFYSIVSLKILLALGTFILILLTSILIAPAKDVQKIVLILSLFLLANNFMGTFYSFFHARQKMEYEAWPELIQVFLLFIFGFYVLLKLPSAENLSYVYFLSSLVALISVLFFFHRKFLPLKLEWDFSVWKRFLSFSWPLALIGLFGLIYGYIDSVMLGFWNMLTEVGWYNAAQRIVTAVLLPMGFIAVSFYPALSQFSEFSKEKFQDIWNKELEIMISVALPLVVGGWILAQKIISAFYPPDFTPSILAFQILILTAGIIFLYRPFYDAMIILNQQTKTFWITITGAIANVILNFILIPKYSLYGAAIATAITNLLIFVVIMFYTVKFTFIRFAFPKISLTLLASGAASVVMYLVIKQPLIYNINIFILVLLGGAAYFLSFFAIKKYILVYVQR